MTAIDISSPRSRSCLRDPLDHDGLFAPPVRREAAVKVQDRDGTTWTFRDTGFPARYIRTQQEHYLNLLSARPLDEVEVEEFSIGDFQTILGASTWSPPETVDDFRTTLERVRALMREQPYYYPLVNWARRGGRTPMQEHIAEWYSQREGRHP